MHSKYFPWEYESEKSQILVNANTPGFYSFFCTDVILSQILFSIKDIKGRTSVKNWKIYTGEELTAERLENDLMGPDLFSEVSHLFIISAQNCSAVVQKHLLDLKDKKLDQKVFLRFDRSRGFFEKILKENFGESATIQGPKPWENHKLVEFIASHLDIDLEWESKELLADQFGSSSKEIKVVLDQLKHQEVKDYKKVLNELLSHKKVNIFDLANSLGSKNFRSFLSSLATINDFDELRGAIQFLRSYLVKLDDPDYTKNKRKLSKFDNEIVKFSKAWNSKLVLNMMKKFGDWEIKSKTKDPNLFVEIKNARLKLL